MVRDGSHEACCQAWESLLPERAQSESPRPPSVSERDLVQNRCSMQPCISMAVNACCAATTSSSTHPASKHIPPRPPSRQPRHPYSRPLPRRRSVPSSAFTGPNSTCANQRSQPLHRLSRSDAPASSRWSPLRSSSLSSRISIQFSLNLAVSVVEMLLLAIAAKLAYVGVMAF